MDELSDRFRNILSPLQCAVFVFFIQKNRYRPELAMWDDNHSMAALEAECDRGKNFKKVKRV
jgi:hypothetical protein